jgi:ribose-phosphate pyrophosphokinase
MADIGLLHFKAEAASALALAKLANLTPGLIERHDFPDGEFKLKLPASLASSVVIFHGLDRPNEKLIELLFAAKTARQLGAKHLTLVAPYLAYMRQDIAFVPGEVVSQRIVGDLLASLFDAVVTVDPHLHRVANLSEAIPVKDAINLSAAPILGDLALKKREQPFLLGPDEESAQWVAQAARAHHLDFAVATKTRLGDCSVDIQMPSINVAGRAVVLLDDIASSGHTLARAAELLLAAGAKTVDVAVTHALFDAQAEAVMMKAGISQIWSTDCVLHASNAVTVMPAMAQALSSLCERVNND